LLREDSVAPTAGNRITGTRRHPRRPAFRPAHPRRALVGSKRRWCWWKYLTPNPASGSKLHEAADQSRRDRRPARVGCRRPLGRPAFLRFEYLERGGLRLATRAIDFQFPNFARKPTVRMGSRMGPGQRGSADVRRSMKSPGRSAVQRRNRTRRDRRGATPERARGSAVGPGQQNLMFEIGPSADRRHRLGYRQGVFTQPRAAVAGPGRPLARQAPRTERP